MARGAIGIAARSRVMPGVLSAHRVDGRLKVLVAVADIAKMQPPGRWTATAFAACDAAEFEPGAPLGYDVRIWSDDDGRISPGRFLEMDDCYGGRRMRVEGRLFVKDPTGYAFDPAQLLTTYLADADLPASTEETSFREGGRRLHVAADGSAAYVESPDGIERWPRVRGDEYIRIDCN